MANPDTVQHVYHHYDNDGARINVSFERNSRGVNFSATVTGGKSVDESIGLLVEAQEKLTAMFQEQDTPSVVSK